MSIEKADYFISAATNSSFTKAAREAGGAIRHQSANCFAGKGAAM